MSEASLVERRRGIVGAARVLTTAADKAAYQSDWRGRYHAEALAVVLPGSVDEVSALVKACVAQDRPAVIVNLSRMNPGQIPHGPGVH